MHKRIIIIRITINYQWNNVLFFYCIIFIPSHHLYFILFYFSSLYFISLYISLYYFILFPHREFNTRGDLHAGANIAVSTDCVCTCCKYLLCVYVLQAFFSSYFCFSDKYNYEHIYIYSSTHLLLSLPLFASFSQAFLKVADVMLSHGSV